MKKIFGALLSLSFLSFSPAGHAALRVVTTTQDLAALTEVVGGGLVKVESLTRGTLDPHFAVARPSMIRKCFRPAFPLLLVAHVRTGGPHPAYCAAHTARCSARPRRPARR